MNVLITGATRGIGFHIALEFMKRGFKVFGIGRDEKRLKEIEKDFPEKFFPLKCDIGKLKEVEELFKFFDESEIEINILVNNAGIGSIGRFSETSWEESRKVIELNAVSLAFITKLFLERVKKIEKEKIISTHSGIINVSSTGAYQSGGPYIAVYYATKSFVKSFTNGIAEEVREYELKVMCLCPGPVKTDFKGMKEAEKNFYVMSPEKTAEKAVSDYFKGKEISIPGKINKFLVFASKFIPRKTELKILKNIQMKKL